VACPLFVFPYVCKAQRRFDNVLAERKESSNRENYEQSFVVYGNVVFFPMNMLDAIPSACP
jgi:hypothetical protein